MPYGQSQGGSPLTDEERAQKVQAVQERRLRKALGDDRFQWLQDFEHDADVLGQD